MSVCGVRDRGVTMAWEFFSATVRSCLGQVRGVVFIGGALVVSAQMATAASSPPIIIDTIADLEAISNNLAGNYVLGGNIYTSASETSGWNNGVGFAPIGSASAPFVGSLNGEGYSIDGLTISSSASNVGLFGYVGATGSLSNLGLTNVTITGTGGAAVVGHARRRQSRNDHAKLCGDWDRLRWTDRDRRKFH